MWVGVGGIDYMGRESMMVVEKKEKGGANERDGAETRGRNEASCSARG